MTTFLFVRHGEPDYDSVGEWKDILFGKDFAGLTELGKKQIEESAAIMARKLKVNVNVEKDLHEWESNLTHTITDNDELLALCKEHNRCNGIYPDGELKKWESTDLVKKRIIACLSKYVKYKCVVVSGHAMMMQAVLGINKPIEYGEIIPYNLDICKVLFV